MQTLHISDLYIDPLFLLSDHHGPGQFHEMTPLLTLIIPCQLYTINLVLNGPLAIPINDVTVML